MVSYSGDLSKSIQYLETFYELTQGQEWQNEEGVFLHDAACIQVSILDTKITAAQNEAALSYHRVRRLQFLAVIFAVIKVTLNIIATIYPYQYSRYQYLYTIVAVKTTVRKYSPRTL